MCSHYNYCKCKNYKLFWSSWSFMLWSVRMLIIIAINACDVINLYSTPFIRPLPAQFTLERNQHATKIMNNESIKNCTTSHFLPPWHRTIIKTHLILHRIRKRRAALSSFGDYYLFLFFFVLRSICKISTGPWSVTAYF